MPVADSGLAAETAGEHLCRDVPLAAPDDPARAVRAALLGRRYESVADVAVVLEGRLVGLVRLEDLFAAADASPLAALLDPDPAVVAPGADQERAAWKAVQHGESSLAVVDEAGRFQGLVPPERLLRVFLTEHDEDLARLSGFQHDVASARQATLEALRARFRHRLPWLLVGLAGALLAALLVSSFEAQLERTVALAFFVPAVVYMADAVGGQTETLIVRGLSVGVVLRDVVLRELATGAMVAAAVAGLAFPIVLAGWGSAVAGAVALALAAGCAAATAVAMAFPWALRLLGQDPAYGSGPLATVAQDLISLLIYLGIASAIV